MILYFQALPLKPRREAAGFPLQESSNLWALQLHMENSGEHAHPTRWEKKGKPTRREVSWSPAKNSEWYSYQN